jgi:spermidine synthase
LTPNRRLATITRGGEVDHILHNARVRAGTFIAVYALFIVSGFTGLAYEVIWTRLLVRIFGASSFAVTTVLASYMAGLALGSLVFGRYIDRKGRPLRVYGFLELGIGAFAVAFLYLLPAMSRLYGGLYPELQGSFYSLTAVRFVLCFTVLLVPTTLMGGTLPVLSKYMATGLDSLTRRVGRLYALNTLGAVGGASAAGLVILPHLGIRNTTLLGAFLNAGIAAAALRLSTARSRSPRPVPEEPDRPHEEAGPSSMKSRYVLAVFTLTGFCALAAEVVWTRMLSLALGTTVYAFAIMLATFLLGLGLGSAAFARLAQRTRYPAALLGFGVAGVGLGVFLSLVVFGRIPVLYMEIYQRLQAGWQGLLGMQVLLAALTVLLPAFLMGSLFPLAARLYARDISRVGGEIGRLYAFNTMGAILGSVAGSFFFLRSLGMETSLFVLGAVYVGTGMALTLGLGEFQRGLRRASAGVGIAALTVLVLLASPRMDRKMLTSGVYVYAPEYRTVNGLMDRVRHVHTLFYDEGVGATVSVERFRGDVSLVIDGKADASTGAKDMRTQILLAQLPLLLHAAPDSVLVIGLGSGVTLGSAETHDVRWIDCVELLENVVAASHNLDAYNLDCLDDPRSNLIIGDGRNHLLLTDRNYDVIISEPPNPWISGVGDLFTREFFLLARARLRPGGLMCAWFHTYMMGDRDVRAMVGTFISVFPHASLWLVNDGDIILLGSLDPLAVGKGLAERMSAPAVARDLARIGIEGPLDLVANYLAGPEKLGEYARQASVLNTDDNMLLEFSAGLRSFESTESIQLANFVAMLEAPPLAGLTDLDSTRVRRQVEARRLALEGTVAQAHGGIGPTLPLLERADSLNPHDAYIHYKYVEGMLTVGNRLYEEGDHAGARDAYLKALAGPESPLAWRVRIGLGSALAAMGDYENARRSLALSIGQNPDNPRAYHSLGRLERIAGRMPEAVTALETSLELEPDAGVASDLSRIYMELGTNLDRAARLAGEAVAWDPTPEHYVTLGWAYNRLGEAGKAERAVLKALDMQPDDTEALYARATMRLAAGDVEAAEAALKRIVALGKHDQYSLLAARKLREVETLRP